MIAPSIARIAVLPTRLANQIAAGEVVERPASVIKELIENSLDAGASRIDLDIEHAGIRRLTLSDNGCGIHRDDLALALARHATSKIQSSDDLAAIRSLGFRGEALASIASVARLTLTSRTREADSAWSAFADGADMAVKLQPAALTQGTRVDVCDLFFNTPARRRFLRSESTETFHIEDVVKRAALSSPSCGFYLRQNGKPWRQWRACKTSGERVAQVLGETSARQFIAFTHTIENVTVSGFLAAPEAHRAQTDQQFVFINGRAIRDRVVQHAIRAGYAQSIPDGRAPAYVVYIELPASDIDVNVHPTKHEVRFRQARWMHDLLTAIVAQSLPNQAPMTITPSSLTPPTFCVSPSQLSSPTNDHYAPRSPHVAPAAISDQQAFYSSLAKAPTAIAREPHATADFVPLENEFALLFCREQWHLVRLPALLSLWLSHVLNTSARRPLVLPVTLPTHDNARDLFSRLRLQSKADAPAMLCAAPSCLADCDWASLVQVWQRDEDAIAQVVAHLLPRFSSASKTLTHVRGWLMLYEGDLSSVARALDAAALERWWQTGAFR